MTGSGADDERVTAGGGSDDTDASDETGESDGDGVVGSDGAVTSDGSVAPEVTTAGDTDDTEVAIMHATYRALCANGFADTTISAIADEFAKSKSLLYYHYDDKEAIFDDFLAFLLAELEANVAATETDDPYDRLWAVIDQLLPPEMDDEGLRFRRALSETRANAPHSVAYHDQFARSDEVILSRLVDAIEAGVESGRFRPVDPEETAEFLYSTVVGGLHRGVTLDDTEPIERTRTALERYLDEAVVAED